MAFHEVRFPIEIAYGSTGGPERRTDVVVLGSGFEERNARWANSRRRYDVGYGIRTLNHLHEVIAFFEARNGRLHGFRFKDYADFKSCPPIDEIAPNNQPIGEGDGSATAFQLVKRYSSGNVDSVREIRKPLAASVRVAANGIELAAGADFTVDDTTGLVTFAVAPANGAAITAGFEFDVPVRFDTDLIQVNLASFEVGEIPNIPIVEIRL
ncbi:DUF2460 domain-containing protein [Rhodoligotrophos defluvii]|uniref:DUF2460 domain-containing protein n=1 Tax=Rhodoligotrophos defluvii TaxID=2561934 RepID=UPI0010C96B99|nr:DUF2460 domain-containing protein [Rhodoligotrophos defluvii]